MSKCLVCRQELRRELGLAEILRFEPIYPVQICYRCEAELEDINQEIHKCQYCQGISQQKKCGDCLVWETHYPGDLLQHESLYRYNEPLADWFNQYKFLGDYRLKGTFSRQLANYFKKQQEWVLVPIPLSEERYQERGFNQVTEMLAAANIEYTPLLKKIIKTEPQSTKTKTERLKTPQPFCLNSSNYGTLTNTSVILVDDVYTTGRTLYHARDCLKESGIVTIKSFSLAR